MRARKTRPIRRPAPIDPQRLGRTLITALLFTLSACQRSATCDVRAGSGGGDTSIPLLQLSSPTTEVTAGDEVVLVEQLQNAFDQIIWHNFRSFRRHAWLVARYETGQSDPTRLGEPLPTLYDADEATGFPRAFWVSWHNARPLRPGDPVTQTIRFRIHEPGVYRFQSVWKSDYSADHQDELWKGKISSNFLEVNVKPGAKPLSPARAMDASLEASVLDDEELTELPSKAELRVLAASGVTDAGLIHLKQMPNLGVLSLWGSDGVTDAGLAHVAHLKQLRDLLLRDTAITDEGLDALRVLPQLSYVGLRATKVTGEGLVRWPALRGVNLSATRVTDEALEHLVNLRTLRYLNLDENAVSDAGMRWLTEMKQLTDLRLGGTKVTAEGVRDVASIGGLRQLDLSGLPIHDKALGHLKNLENLTALDLSDTTLSDEAVRYLKDMPSLKKVVLYRSGISEDALLRLRDARPGLQINPDTDIFDHGADADAVDASFELKIRRHQPSGFAEVDGSAMHCRTKFSADGKRLLSVINDSIFVWEIPAMELARGRLIQPSAVEAADITACGSRILTCDGDGNLKVWEVEKDAPLWSLQHPGGFAVASFSPDDKTVLIVRCGERTAKILEAENGRTLIEVTDDTNTKPIRTAIFSPDGRAFLTESLYGYPKVWSVETGALITTLDVRGNRDIAFSPDGRKIAQNTTARVTVSDAGTGKKLVATQFQDRADSQVANIFAVAFAPDGRTIATAAEGHVQIWDAETGKPVTGMLEVAGVLSLSYSPSAKYLATAGRTDDPAVWEVATGRRVCTITKATRSALRSVVAFSPAGRFLAVNFGETIELWEYGE